MMIISSRKSIASSISTFGVIMSLFDKRSSKSFHSDPIIKKFKENKDNIIIDRDGVVSLDLDSREVKKRIRAEFEKLKHLQKSA